MPDAHSTIFISYAHTDSPFVDRLEADLRQHGFAPWVDRHGLSGGQKWRRDLQEAVDRADVVLVVLSPEGVASEYVQNEYAYAVEEGKVILPLYYRPCKVPLELRGIQWIDFQHSYERGFEALLDALHRQQERAAASTSLDQTSPGDNKAIGTPVSTSYRIELAGKEQAEAEQTHFNNLPAQLTTLIGREQEIQEDCTLLLQAEIRLLTLVGTGGVGKTRLALQIATNLLEDFTNGACFVSLAPISDPTLVISTIAQTFSLRETSDQSQFEQLKAYLHEKHLLLVLDNFEQVVTAAPLLSELLEACSHLKILVTSRAVLNVRGEHPFPVSPLTVPDLTELPDLKDLSHSPSVALFLERASAVNPHFELTQANAASIAELCVHLEGLPLAIELAAARIKVFSPQSLLARLSQSLQLLSGGARDLPARQQTLSNTIKWSYDLLDQEAQTVFRLLSVFQGGCTLEAVEAVCQGVGKANLDVVNALSILLDNSLLQQREPQAEEPYFFMLETVREYGLECLRLAGEEEQARRQHAYYYAQRAEAASSLGSMQETLDLELVQGFPNGRAALHWAAQQREIALGLQLATYFGRLWFIHGQIREANAWLEEMLAQDARAGEQAAPLSLRIAALNAAAHIAMSLGHTERATALAQEGLQLAERIADPAGISDALGNLGRIAQVRGQREQAAIYFEESYLQAKRPGGYSELGRALYNLAGIARLQGDLVRASALLEEALSHARTHNFRWAIANTLTMLGHLAREQHDYPLAKVRYRESLELYRMIGNSTYTGWCLEGIAALLCAEHHYEPAIELSAAATTLRLKERTPLPPTEQKLFDQTVKQARAAVDEETFAQAWAAGATLTQNEAIDYALSSIAS